MNSLRSFFSWLRGKDRLRRDADLQRELQSHLELEAEEQRSAGASEEQSRYAAQRILGNTLRVVEETHSAWGWATLERLGQDLRFATRMLRKNIGFTALAILVLALGIGANSVIFSVVNAALLRPLPYDQPDRLVQVFHTPPQKVFPGRTIFAVSIANFLDWRRQQHVFEHIALVHFHPMNLTGTGRPDANRGVEVTEDFFAVMHAQPLLGRVFTPDEMTPGHEREVVLSYELWQSHFGGDLGVIGRNYTFDGQSYTVIGVMPDRFRLPGVARMWIPTAWTAKDRDNRINHNSLVIARLNPGVSRQQAQAEMDTISRRLEQAYPAEDTGWGATMIPIPPQLHAVFARAGSLMMLIVTLVLLIACTNVANLMLAKTLARRKEMAVRTALGATRGRLLQHLMVEASMLSLGGGALGLLLAHYGTNLLVVFFGNQLPSSVEVRLDGWVLAFTFGISVLCGLLAGLLPGIRLTRSDRRLQDVLKEGVSRTDSDSGGSRTRNLLVVVEVALSMVLLVAAGLLVRTLWVLSGMDTGFDPRNVTTVRIPHPPGLPDPRQVIFMQQVLEGVRSLPGVEAAAATDNVPLSFNGGGSNLPVQLEGQAERPVAEQPSVPSDVVTTGYFATLRIPMLRGRDFNESDTGESPFVIVISESMAKRLWPNQDPIGRRLSISMPMYSPGKQREVVGIVGDTRSRGLQDTVPRAMMYVPHAQMPVGFMSLLVRSRNSSAGLMPEITRAVHAVDKEQPLLEPKTMEEVIGESFSDRRLNMWLLVAFAGLALLLAAAGIYGVLAYSVRRRLREVGIRMALGAQIADVLRLILMEGLRPVLLGVLLGIGGALALGHVFTSLIYGVKPADPRTFAAVTVILVAVSVGASLLPAYRATRVQPLDVLREE